MLVSLKKIDFGIGGPLLLEQVNLDIEQGERVCLVGRNGAGKSTLLKLIDGEIQPDDGEVVTGPGVCVARLQQEVPENADGSVYDQVAAGLGDVGALLAEYHYVSQGEFDANKLATVQEKIDAANGWDLDNQVVKVLDKLNLDGDQAFSDLSGGMKRRVALGQALVQQPDVLLLDEPTNHLDI